LINPEELVKAGLVKKNHGLIKILGDGELNVKLTVAANKFSKSAEKRITDAGGKIEVV
jgi:large subunit ribosomal protein L15